MHDIITSFKNYAEAIGVLLTLFLFVIGFVIERKTRKIQTTLTWKEFRDPIIHFSNDVIFTLSEAAGLCDTDPLKIGIDEYLKRYNANLTKLTSYIDQGRLVIPNLFLANNSAYGGLRNKALDCILAGYKVSKAIHYEKPAFNKMPVTDINDVQYKKIKEGLEKLPNQEQVNIIEIHPKFKGWSCKYALIEIKRQFVDEISGLVEARQWANDIKELANRH